MKKRRAELLAKKRRAFTATRRRRKPRRPFIERPLPEVWPW